jgi:hypothetical protein
MSNLRRSLKVTSARQPRDDTRLWVIGSLFSGFQFRGVGKVGLVYLGSPKIDVDPRG